MTPDAAPRRRNRRPTTPPTLEDLDGYLVGVRRRVAERQADGAEDPGLEGQLELAEKALSSGNLERADRILRDLDERLDALTPEVEMLDRPRGLVHFRTTGDPGVPMGTEEDPVANRLVLVGRLATVRESQGAEVGEPRRLLALAKAAYAEGDRAGARKAVDRAHELLEHGTDGGTRSRTP